MCVSHTTSDYWLWYILVWHEVKVTSLHMRYYKNKYMYICRKLTMYACIHRNLVYTQIDRATCFATNITINIILWVSYWYIWSRFGYVHIVPISTRARKSRSITSQLSQNTRSIGQPPQSKTLTQSCVMYTSRVYFRILLMRGKNLVPNLWGGGGQGTWGKPVSRGGGISPIRGQKHPLAPHLK